MREKYYYRYLVGLAFGLLIMISACQKENKNSGQSTTSSNLSSTTTTTPTPLNIGLWETDSSIYRLLFIGVPKIGTQTVNQFLVFDTGSGGMVIDGNELLPASMITKNG